MKPRSAALALLCALMALSALLAPSPDSSVRVESAAALPTNPDLLRYEAGVEQTVVAERDRLAAESKAVVEAMDALHRQQAREAALRRQAQRISRSAPRPAVSAPPAAVVPQGEIEQAICNAFGSACQKAIRVARCESTMNPRATNGSHRGLFQISTYWHKDRIARMGYTLDQMWEVGPNIAVALAIYREQGWGPWACA